MDDKDLGYGLICLWNFSRSRTAERVFIRIIKKNLGDKYSPRLESKFYSAGLLTLPLPRLRATLFGTKDLTPEMILRSKKLILMQPDMEKLVYAKFNGQLNPETREQVKSKIVSLNIPFSYIFPYVPELETLLESELPPYTEEYVKTYG